MISDYSRLLIKNVVMNKQAASSMYRHFTDNQNYLTWKRIFFFITFRFLVNENGSDIR